MQPNQGAQHVLSSVVAFASSALHGPLKEWPTMAEVSGWQNSKVSPYVTTDVGSYAQRVDSREPFLFETSISEQGVLIIGLYIDEDYLATHGSTAENGYAKSISLTSISVEDARVSLFSCVHIAPSLVEALKSDAVTTLTRCSLSHYECFMEVNCHSELNVASMEIVVALATSTPHSSKVRISSDALCKRKRLSSLISSWL
eukprot:6483153-Amphidinium_carterae.2